MDNSFTIFITTYNGMAYLEQCIESCLQQTYTNFNIAIVDSGSNDGTLAYLESLKNSKIEIFKTHKRLYIEENWGRIRGIEKNDFITIMGQDDTLCPTFLETINILINKDPTASLYHTHFNFINAKGEVIRQAKPMAAKYSAEDFTRAFLSNNFDSMGTGCVCRVVDYKKVGGIPTNFPNLLFADFALWLSLTELSYMVIASENCFAFRLHTSVTNTSSNEKYISAFEMFIQFLRSKMNNTSIRKAISENANAYFYKNTQAIVHRLVKTPTVLRQKDETVNNFLKRIEIAYHSLLPTNAFMANKNLSVLLAKIIDSNLVSKKIFLGFKKVLGKSILK